MKSSTGNVTNFIVSSKRQVTDTHGLDASLRKRSSLRVGEQHLSDEDKAAAFDEQSAVNNLLLEGEEAFDKDNIHMKMRLKTQQVFNIKGSAMKQMSNTKNTMISSAKSELLVKKQMMNPVLMQI